MKTFLSEKSSFGSSSASAANIPGTVVKQPVIQSVIQAVQQPAVDYEEAYHQVVERHEAQGTDVSQLPEKELEVLRQEAQAMVQSRSFWAILLAQPVLGISKVTIPSSSVLQESPSGLAGIFLR